MMQPAVVDISHIEKYQPPLLVGREAETARLWKAWDDAVKQEVNCTRAFTLCGMGGQGKSSLVASWVSKLQKAKWPNCDGVLAWSFYSYGLENIESSAAIFLNYALALFGERRYASRSPEEKGLRLWELLREKRILLILDGIELLQFAPSANCAGQLREAGIKMLLSKLSKESRGLCILTTRVPIEGTLNTPCSSVWELEPLSTSSGVTLLKSLGVVGDETSIAQSIQEVHGHPLTVTLLGSFLYRAYGGNIANRSHIDWLKADLMQAGGHAFRVIEAYEHWLSRDAVTGGREVALLKLSSLFDRPIHWGEIQRLSSVKLRGLNDHLTDCDPDEVRISLRNLERCHLINIVISNGSDLPSVDVHPLVRQYFARKIAPLLRESAFRLLVSGETQNVALSLSGGGFRATFFHVGVLAFLMRRATLEKVSVITAVSGGSILAAHAVLNWDILKSGEEGFRNIITQLVTFSRSNIRDRILARWLWSVGTAWRFMGRKRNRQRKSRSGRLIEAYQSLFKGAVLRELHQPGRPSLLLVATDQWNGSRIYFSGDGMRRLSIDSDKRLEPFPDDIELDVAYAVAASSCFPPVFRPLHFDYSVLNLTWREYSLKMRLQDGGVHDNLGLRALQYGFETDGTELSEIYASYAVNPGLREEPKNGLFADLRRALSLFTRGESAKIADDIALQVGGKAMQIKLGNRVTAQKPRLLSDALQTALMAYRTDLDSPSWAEIYCLMAHGYHIAASEADGLDQEDLAAASRLFGEIIASAMSKEGRSISEANSAAGKLVSNLNENSLRRCDVRPKRRILLHAATYVLAVICLAMVAWQAHAPAIPSTFGTASEAPTTSVTHPEDLPIRDNGYASLQQKPFGITLYENTGSAPTDLRTLETVNEVARACVLVGRVGEESLFSGTIIGPDYVLTCRRGIEDANAKLCVRLGAGHPLDTSLPPSELPAELYASGAGERSSQTGLDFAILKVEGLRDYITKFKVTPVPLGALNGGVGDGIFVKAGFRKEVSFGHILFPLEITVSDKERLHAHLVARSNHLVDLKEKELRFDKLYVAMVYGGYACRDAKGRPQIGIACRTFVGDAGSSVIILSHGRPRILGILVAGMEPKFSPYYGDVDAYESVLPSKIISAVLDAKLPNWKAITSVEVEE